jgi:hypothetical protein
MQSAMAVARAAADVAQVAQVPGAIRRADSSRPAVGWWCGAYGQAGMAGAS